MNTGFIKNNFFDSKKANLVNSRFIQRKGIMTKFFFKTFLIFFDPMMSL